MIAEGYEKAKNEALKILDTFKEYKEKIDSSLLT